jgi:Glycosyl transferase family 11
MLHIRGGDYLKDTSGIGNLNQNYFKQCLSATARNDDEIWIFTDDRDHASKLLTNLSYNFVFIDQDNMLSPFSSVYLMSKGKRIIISNSTFSWCAAYLSAQSQIYSPTKWLQKLSDPMYLIPDSWNRVTSEWL